MVAHSTKAARTKADKWDPGHVGGSAAWHDAARAVLSMQRGDSEGKPTLALVKANQGPARLACRPSIVRAGDGTPVGFGADDYGWQTEADFDKADDAKPNKPAAGNGDPKHAHWTER